MPRPQPSTSSPTAETTTATPDTETETTVPPEDRAGPVSVEDLGPDLEADNPNRADQATETDEVRAAPAPVVIIRREIKKPAKPSIVVQKKRVVIVEKKAKPALTVVTAHEETPNVTVGSA